MAPAASAQSSLTFGKVFSPDVIGPGSTSKLTFTINNQTASAVSSLAFTDTLPAGVTIASPASASTNCLNATLAAPAGGSTITFSGGDLGGFRSCTVKVNVTSSTPGTHTNTSGTLTSSAGSHGTASDDLTVSTSLPGFSKSFSPSTVPFGGRSTLTFTIDNTANASAVTNLDFTDALPSGMVVADPAAASTDCGTATIPPVLTATAGSSTVTLDADGVTAFPAVAAGASCTVTVDVVANGSGVLANVSGDLLANFVPSGKATAALTVTITNLALIKRFTDDPVPPGGTVTLEFTILNRSRDLTATGVGFTDDLDAVLPGTPDLAVSGALPTNPCGSGSTLSVAAPNVLTLSGGTVAPGGSCTFSVTLVVPSGAASGRYTNTTGAVTSDSTTGNAASDDLFVAAIPILTKEFTDDPIGAGSSFTLRFTITDTSAGGSTDIAFSDELTSFLPFPISATLPSDPCGTGSSISLASCGTDCQALSLSGGNLSAGGSCSFDVVVDVPPGVGAGLYVNTTSPVTATVDGETVQGSAATDTLEVFAGPHLRKEFTDDPATPGGTVTLQFSLEHEENAPGDATGITFSDDLTAVLSGLAATGLPLVDPCGTGSQLAGTTNLSFTGGSLAPGEECIFSVTLDVPASAASGSYTNTTSNVLATVVGQQTTELAAANDLMIEGLTLSKEFTDDPVLPGGAVTLEFTITNASATEAASDIFFQDDLDAVIANLAATGLPANDICGTGSSLTGLSSNTFLVFQGGSLAAGASCTFAVTVNVPAAAEPDTYPNLTRGFQATIGGSTVSFENAFDELVIEEVLLSLTKEFIDDPVAPGGNVTLRFTLLNLASLDATGIAFSDDLDAALSGLSAVGLPLSACGGTVSGISTISLSGGSLLAGASCSFDVTVAVPATAPLGTVVVNTTSQVSGNIGAMGIVGDPASDELTLSALTFAKSFDAVAVPGGTVGLTFTIQNQGTVSEVIDLAFSDDLDAVLSGLVATGLPVNDVCGTGSVLSGTSVIILTGGSLLPGGSCTFGVTLQVPATAVPDDYDNITSDLQQFGGALAALPATATLTVIEVADDDGDGVPNDLDVCADTTIPEGVPTVSLGTNRHALVDGDGIFDTNPPNGGGPGVVFTIVDTAGCSCEQIIDALGLGKGHEKFGCSKGAMETWIDLVNP